MRGHDAILRRPRANAKRAVTPCSRSRITGAQSARETGGSDGEDQYRDRTGGARAACGRVRGGSSNEKPTPTQLARAAKGTPTLDSTQAPIATAWKRLSEITPRPTATPLIADPGVRPCRESDVVAALAGRNGASMHGFFDIGLGNRSSTACQLRALPELRGRDDGGQVLRLDVSIAEPCPSKDPLGSYCVFPYPVLLLPGLGDITQQHRLKSGQAVFVLSLLSPLACPSPARALAIAAVGLILPDNGGEVQVRDLSFSACGGHVDVISFAPTTALN
jgi:hypothetical protein